MGAWVYWRTWYSYILCTGVCTRVLEGTGEHTVINIFWLGVHVWWSVLENIQIYIYHVQCTCVFTGALEGTEEHTVIYILYMCMYRGVRGYWRTYSYIYHVHVYVQGFWRVLENIQLYISCTCVCTGVLEGTGEHTAIFIMYMCIYRGAGGYWRTYSAPDLATPQAFSTDPSLGRVGT